MSKPGFLHLLVPTLCVGIALVPTLPTSCKGDVSPYAANGVPSCSAETSALRALSQRRQDQPIVGGQILGVCARNAMQSINHLGCKDLGHAHGLRRPNRATKPSALRPSAEIEPALRGYRGCQTIVVAALTSPMQDVVTVAARCTTRRHPCRSISANKTCTASVKPGNTDAPLSVSVTVNVTTCVGAV